MSSRAQSPAKRLLTELQTYQSEPNDALVELGPVSDSELTHWTAVMKGVPGTAYEGTRHSFLFVSIRNIPTVTLPEDSANRTNYMLRVLHTGTPK